MTSQDADQVLRGRELQRELNELQETQQWVHHVADLDNGQLYTTALDRPPAPLSRAERLARLGHRFGTSIFDGPSYRLTPRRPYIASPEASLGASEVDFYSTESDTIFWQPPQVFPQGVGFSPGLNLSFEISPDDRALVSILVTAHAWQGLTGHVRIEPAWTSTKVRIPITQTFGTHTLDLTFVPLGGRQSFIRMIIEEGVRFFTFHSVFFGSPPPVLDSSIS